MSAKHTSTPLPVGEECSVIARDTAMATLERIAYDATLTALDMAAMAREAIQGASK
jgi:hypothetical protein